MKLPFFGNLSFHVFASSPGPNPQIHHKNPPVSPIYLPQPQATAAFPTNCACPGRSTRRPATRGCDSPGAPWAPRRCQRPSPAPQTSGRFRAGGWKRKQGGVHHIQSIAIEKIVWLRSRKRFWKKIWEDRCQITPSHSIKQPSLLAGFKIFPCLRLPRQILTIWKP